MEVLYPRCAGLDVHKDTVVACVRCVSPPSHHEVRGFDTTTSGLLALADWLASHGCTHVAMEATGVYWKPVWHILEDHFDLVLANAQHIRNVPGRKTDVNDAMWIADLLAHGLIRSSFVPPAAIQELRDLVDSRWLAGRSTLGVDSGGVRVLARERPDASRRQRVARKPQRRLSPTPRPHAVTRTGPVPRAR